MRKNKRLLCVCLSALMLFLSGCNLYRLPDLENHNLDDFYKEDAKVYHTLYSSELLSLDYLNADPTDYNEIYANVIDTLIDYDSFGHEMPGLALSWESNEDTTVWTFHLRDDATWVDYNGNYYDKVVADDWVCASEHAQEKNDLTNIDYSVEALDDVTLVYTLEKPCPFFTSMLSGYNFLPVSRSFYDKMGTLFAKDYMSLLYNGAYILHYFQPFEQQILVKNPSYWDKDNVFIDRVENYYDYDTADVSVEAFLKGDVDKAIIPYDYLQEYLDDPELSKYIHQSRPDSTISYFYAFNFNPKFDEKYEPENWAKAVVNENFRKAIMFSLDRETLVSIYDPYEPQNLISNTITPPRSLWVDGKDYTSLSALSSIAGRDSFSSAQAKYYRKIAKQELYEAGVKFPIKVLMPYDPSVSGWKKEAYAAEVMIETTLGRGFVDVIVEAGNDADFTEYVVEQGKYAFTKNRWMASYSDPLTWAEAFNDDNEYTFWNRCQDAKIKFIYAKWKFNVIEGTNIYYSTERRYNAFAEAEKILINNAIVVPISILNGDGYKMCKLNEFEGEYAPYGNANIRYKYLHLYDESMSFEEYQEAYNKWLKGF